MLDKKSETYLWNKCFDPTLAYRASNRIVFSVNLAYINLNLRLYQRFFAVRQGVKVSPSPQYTFYIISPAWSRGSLDKARDTIRRLLITTFS